MLGEILKPHIKGFLIDPDFYEDYSVFVTDKTDPALDPVILLIGERINVCSQMREEILKNSLQYTTDDLVVLSYDGAFICDPASPNDVIDLIEFANVQVLELRYYDRELARQIEKMYDDIEESDRLSPFFRSRKYHAIMAKQMESHAEISEVIEKVITFSRLQRTSIMRGLCNGPQSAQEQSVERKCQQEDRGNTGKLLDAIRRSAYPAFKLARMDYYYPDCT